MALRIPRPIAERHHLYNGVSVAFRENRQGVFIVSVAESHPKKRLPTLKEALANFKPAMIEIVEWGKDVGGEIIN